MFEMYYKKKGRMLEIWKCKRCNELRSNLFTHIHGTPLHQDAVAVMEQEKERRKAVLREALNR